MGKEKRTPAGEALSGMMLDLFRVSSLALTAGDRLVASLGLTSARWQVLGAIIRAERPQPVAWIARDLGTHRQNVQRIINDLNKDDLVDFEPNPHHRRAQLVVLTGKGRRAFSEAMQMQAPWISRIADGITVKELEAVRRVINMLKENLEAEESLSRRDR
jgi:DNA-binding MarR family transcriptional regulator